MLLLVSMLLFTSDASLLEMDERRRLRDRPRLLALPLPRSTDVMMVGGSSAACAANDAALISLLLVLLGKRGECVGVGVGA